MIEASVSNSAEHPVEAIMREELAHGDLSLGTIGPIMGHLLANGSTALFSEETVARVRGMVDHLARQFLVAQGQAADYADPGEFAAEEAGRLADHLVRDPALVAHCHARALEWQLAARLQQSHDIDHVLTPHMQALIASETDDTASLAMAALAAQARFTQQVRRMELPVTELATALFHQALLNWRSFLDDADDAVIDRAEAELRNVFDEAGRREALLSRLVLEMGGNAAAMLNVADSGVALFLSALALTTGQNRDLTMQSTSERQIARLALGLRSAGLNDAEVENQFLYIHPEITLPEGFETLSEDRAGQMLAVSSRSAKG